MVRVGVSEAGAASASFSGPQEIIVFKNYKLSCEIV